MPIDAVEDSLAVYEDQDTAVLDATSLELFPNDTYNSLPADSSTVTAMLSSADAYTVDNGGKIVLNTETHNLFSSLLSADDEVQTTLPGASLDANTGILSWSANAQEGKYLVAYTICDKTNLLNCDTAPVLISISRFPRTGKVQAHDDTLVSIRKDGGYSDTLYLTPLTNDEYFSSSTPLNAEKAHTGNVDITLVNPTSGEYSIDTTIKTIDGHMVIATIE